MENKEVKYKNRHQQIVNTNFKTCSVCQINKKIKDFVAISKNILERKSICRKCESNVRKKTAIESLTKHCPKCDKTYDKSNFPSDTSRIDGLYGLCKSCKAVQDSDYKKNNPEKMKELSKRRMSVIDNRIAHNLRTRLRNAVVRKDKSTIDYVGISNKELLKWIEYQFQFDDNISWDNYGTYWQIDHVIPCESFDLTKEENIYTCFNWTNLRPLEKQENNKKKNKILVNEIENQKNIVKEYKKIINKEIEV
jgi:hypothetical protein